jgi:hypothetical protein
MVIRARCGRTTLGCLFTLLIIVTIGYFAANVGRVYLRYYRFQDAMAQEARFAARNSNDVIVERLRAMADSLGLPDGAHKIHIRRARNTISIWSSYIELVELPGVTREFDFTAHVERAF